jgi:FHA domain
MSGATCPSGHASTSTDYCDVCGAPMTAVAAASAAAVPAASVPAPESSACEVCANCQTENVPGALFCERCGYDFTTGALPRVASLDLGPAAGASGGSAGVAASGREAAGSAAPGATAAVTAGSAAPGATGSAPTPLAPAVPFEWVAEVWVDPDWYAAQDCTEPCPSPGLPTATPLTLRTLLIGRESRSRNIHPEIDCGEDIGVSRLQAQLSTDGSRWWIDDMQSSNGTYIGQDGGPLPTRPLIPGQRHELAEGERVYVGAWTRVVLRRATDEEKAGQA